VGDFPHEYLKGFNVFGVRVVPDLVRRLFRERYDVVIKDVQGRFALPATYVSARLAGTRFVLWTGLWHRLGTLPHRLFFPVTRYFYRHADAVVVYGEHVKRYLESEGVSSNRIFVAHHAVDNVAYATPVDEERIAACRRALGVSTESRIVLFFGRVEREKGLEDLLQAFAHISDPHVTLVIAGSGSRTDDVRDLTSRLGISQRVKFSGYVQPDDAPVFYASAEVLVLPSVTTSTFKEPWGLVVNEAFNQGLPVIISDSVGAGAGGLVRDNENGLIVPERAVPQLAAAMSRVLTEPGLRDRLSTGARMTVREWSNDRMVHGFLQAIDFVTAGSNQG
jgi:glycosyltransferase involved in cell wall biosynthesis